MIGLSVPERQTLCNRCGGGIMRRIKKEGKMYSFRFNPVFEQWVLLGGQFASSLAVSAAHKIDVGRQGDFAAVTYPRQPFLLDPPSTSKHRRADPLVYA